MGFNYNLKKNLISHFFYSFACYNLSTLLVYKKMNMPELNICVACSRATLRAVIFITTV